jgi:malonate transporter and related proteins
VNIAQLLFPDFSLILTGYLLCRFTALNRSVWTPIDGLVYHFLFPVLLFHSIVRHPLQLSSVSSLGAAGLCLAAVGIGLAYAWPRWPIWPFGRQMHGTDPLRLHAASAQVAFRFNSFIALALVDKVAGPQGTQLVAVLIGLCVPVFNMGAVYPMHRNRHLLDAGAHGSGKPPSLLAELMRNPLILATTTGLVANVAGFHIPVWLEPTVTRIGGASLALGLMAAGAGMQMGSLARAKTLAVVVLVQKHLLLPLVAVGMAKLWELNGTETTVLLMFSALPTASTCYVLAARMGYDGGYVAGLVTLSTLLGMVSLPLALGPLRAL